MKHSEMRPSRRQPRATASTSPVEREIRLAVGDIEIRISVAALRDNQSVTSRSAPVPSIETGAAEEFLAAWYDGKIGIPLVPARSHVLFLAYRSWCTRRGTHCAAEIRFLADVARLARRLVGRWRDGKRLRQGVFIVPAGVQPPDSESQTDWLTRCVVEFEEAAAVSRASAAAPKRGGRGAKRSR